MEPGSLVRFKIFTKDTEGVIELYERELPAHVIGADPHVHASTTETFYVVEGRPTILCGDTQGEYSPGAIVVVPPNTVHGYSNNTGERVKVLICFTPALGHEEFFRELSRLKAGPRDHYQSKLDSLRTRFDSRSVPAEPSSGDRTW